jgi:hypothetical protein
MLLPGEKHRMEHELSANAANSDNLEYGTGYFRMEIKRKRD